MVHITPEAAAQLRRLHDAEADGELSVRLGLRPGGCAGTKVVFEGIERPDPDDVVFETGRLSVVCDRVTLSRVDGMRVDYVEAMVGGGFRFENPRAGRTCACGASFAPSD